MERERTVYYPHRIAKVFSFFLTKQEKKYTNEEDYHFISETRCFDDAYFTITSKRAKLTPQDGRIFDYILSRIQSIYKGNLDATIETRDIINVLQYQNRTENRDKIINHIKNLVGVKIKLISTTTNDKLDFGLLESFISRGDNSSFDVKLDKSFVDTINNNNIKLEATINKQKTAIVTGAAIELAKVLQMHGQGVTGKGEPLAVKEITHSTLCIFLNLDKNKKTSKTQLRKSFNELNTLGYPNYTFKSRLNLWQKLE